MPAADRARLAAIADRLRATDRGLSESFVTAPDVAPGCLPGPALLIEDHSAIALFERAGDLAYSYRALLLAGSGDSLVIGIPRNDAFETYCRERLGLGQVEIETPRAADPQRPLAARAADDPAVLARLAAKARRAGGLTVVPYMGTGHVWRLAGRIAAAAERRIRVAAPPPNLVRRVNDKSWFAARVAEALGPRAAPPSATAYGFAALAGHLARFSKRYPSVAVKLTESASSAGNLVYAAADLASLSPSRIAETLRGRLQALGWPGAFPLIVTAWEQPIVASPSAQLWLPERDEGPPVVEGIFDQLVAGAAAVFSGAAPSALPGDWQRRAAHEALQLATLFQALGYYGRCSFDAIVTGDDDSPKELHWVECNGRWGGVSIPMTLANRLTSDWTLMPPMIIERVGLQGTPRALSELLAELRDELFEAKRRPHGLVLLSPGGIEQGDRFEVMLLEPPSPNRAARAREIERKLLQAMRVPEN